MRIDLGGRLVDIYHFGRGNTAGDTVVYSPDGRVAWTGNFVVGEQFIPPIFDPVTREYLASVRAFADTLDVATHSWPRQTDRWRHACPLPGLSH